MEKLTMCRICLAQNTRMYVVVNKNLRELYEKLTDVPFVTEDRRPILACFFCCVKLKQCFGLMRKCLEAEKLFVQMTNEDYEPNPSINPEHLRLCRGFTITPIEHISIVEKGQTQSIIAIKEEPPEVCEGVDDIQGNLSNESINLTEELPHVFDRLHDIIENQSDDLKLEDAGNSYLDVENMHLQHSESDLRDDVPLMEVSIKVEEALEVPKKKHKAVDTTSAPVTRKRKLEDTITAEQKKNEPSKLKDFRTTRNRTSKTGSSYEEPDECDQRSLNEVKTLKQHTRTRISKKRYECDVCQRNFIYKGVLTNHIIQTHTGEKPFKCELCQRDFGRKSELNKHIRIHTGVKPYSCDICQRSFSVKSQLIKHVRIHTGEKPYKCDICQRSFRLSNDVIKHKRIHTGEKPYKCDMCQRSFTLNTNLLKHVRMHTGEKPYSCDMCQRSFRLNNDLKRHVIIHTGLKPYKCGICQRSFNAKSNLKRHVQIHR